MNFSRALATINAQELTQEQDVIDCIDNLIELERHAEKETTDDFSFASGFGPLHEMISDI